MPIAATCVIYAVGILLKIIFREPNETKNTTFFVMLNGLHTCMMPTELKKGPGGTSLMINLLNDVTLDPC
jgi:hypothetical protein